MSAPATLSRCHLCGSPEVTADAPIGNATCDECRPIREHVVSMQTASGGGSLAVCPCGWRSEVNGPRRYLVQETKVRLHWREVIRRTVADFDAAFGEGSAVRELAGTNLALVLGAMGGGGTLLVLQAIVERAS